MDIKPPNIMLSPSLNKAVFIDFGFAEVLAEECGFKTMTSFRGTMFYTSPEMRKLYLNVAGWVDLYYNDLFGLQMSLQSP